MISYNDLIQISFLHTNKMYDELLQYVQNKINEKGLIKFLNKVKSLKYITETDSINLNYKDRELIIYKENFLKNLPTDSISTHIVDATVDKETGSTSIDRYTVVQDAGKAIHPSYVEGQMQGGSVQGIGWALNEEYIYNNEGKLQNPGFLDYRIPVSSDLPMIDPVILEIPNPGHPYGVRGVGETSIVPPLAAINNAVSRATNIRFSELPLSPPRVLKAILSNL